MHAINDKLRKYTNMKSIFLQNYMNAQAVYNPKYQKPTVVVLISI
jgi:hypothetical protein